LDSPKSEYRYATEMRHVPGRGIAAGRGGKWGLNAKRPADAGLFVALPHQGVQSGGAVMPPGRYGSPRRLSSQRSSRLLMNELRCLPGLPLPPLAPGFDAAELRIVAK